MRPINADTLRNKVHKAILEIADTPLPNDYASKLAVKMGEVFRKLIDEESTIDAEPVRHGRWENAKSAFHKKCSRCKCILHMPRERNYCPNCGAKMDTEDEE